MSTQASVGRIEAADIDEYFQVVPPWDVIPRQMSPGRFSGRSEYVQVNGILIYREHWAKRTVVQGASPPGFFMIGGPSRPETQIDWCGAEVGAACLAYAWDSAEVDFVIPDASDHWVVLMPNDVAMQWLDQESQEKELLRDRRHWECAPESGKALNLLVHRLIDKYLAHGELLADERECKAVEAQLLETFGKVVRADRGDQVSPRTRHIAFRRAIDYVESISRLITVPELAVAAGVTQRVLERAFREALGMTPVRYMRWHRMNRAYRELCATEPESSQVTKVALDWGFHDLGRFATRYRKLFGESPSTTLARKPRQSTKSLADTFPDGTSR